MPEDTYDGIPRTKILWDPKIEYKKCESCGKCVDFCHMKAFKSEERDCGKRRITVILNKCVVFCRGCEDICPAGAISHPSEEETQKTIETLQEAALS
jgi:formate hydrogenlyase subunit 6/NADH:ubiquinone oxidoreductase subunit I